MRRKLLKRIIITVMMSATLLTMMGCSNQKAGNKATTESAIDQVLQQQVEAESTTEATTTETTTTEVTTEATTEREDLTEVAISENVESYDQVDVDMTTMDSNMVYYTVSNIMAYPDDYRDKVLRFKGNYGTGFDDGNNQYYHYAIIQDATACCAQGFEFIWGDGSRVWPDEYPSDGQEVIITGVFETYREPGVPYEYARVRSATLEVVE